VLEVTTMNPQHASDTANINTRLNQYVKNA